MRLAALFHTPSNATPSSVSKAVIKALPSTGVPRVISSIRRRTPVAEASAAAPEMVRVGSTLTPLPATGPATAALPASPSSVTCTRMSPEGFALA